MSQVFENLSPDDVTAIMMSLPEVARLGSGFIYHDGDLTVPDEYVAAVQALQSDMPTAHRVVLVGYALRKQETLATSSIVTVTVGSGKTIKATLDATSLAWLNGAKILADASPSFATVWVDVDHKVTSLSAAQVQTIFAAVQTFIQATLTALSTVVAEINDGTITDAAGVDAFAWPTA